MRGQTTTPVSEDLWDSATIRSLIEAPMVESEDSSNGGGHHVRANCWLCRLINRHSRGDQTVR